jgi:hypothetical protein
MKELKLEVESLEERIAPCCCDPSLVTVNANPSVTAYSSNVNVGPQVNNSVIVGSGTVQQGNAQAAGSGASAYVSNNYSG